jgi:enolase
MKITQIKAREILDSRGNPTVEVDLVIDNQFKGRAAVPSGASTGTYEALEMRDGDSARYKGQGVLKAIENVHSKIAPELMAASESSELSQTDLDNLMLKLDGTDTKQNLGANGILAVSLAYAWAVSAAKGIPLYKYVGDLYGTKEYKMPRPMLNIMNGGKHAGWATDIQEYMVFPMKAPTWKEKIRIGAEIYLYLQDIIKKKGLSTNVGNEGGFAPNLSSNQEALDMIVQAIEQAGYKLGDDVKVGFDAAASEFYNAETHMYDLKRDKQSLTPEQMVTWVEDLTKKYPVESLEDMLSEDDWEHWTALTAKIGGHSQIVGDDLLVTNVKRIEKAIAEKSCNALLVKVNQIGSLTEALAAMKMAESAGWANVVSHRSGETEDVTISHIAVGTGCGQIKTGAPSRGERTAKYNELTRIAEEVEANA